MSDFTERARAEAERLSQYEMCSVAHRSGFVAGAEWARRELLADPTPDEIEDAAGRPCRDVDTVDVHTIITTFLEARRGSE